MATSDRTNQKPTELTLSAIKELSARRLIDYLLHLLAIWLEEQSRQSSSSGQSAEQTLIGQVEQVMRTALTSGSSEGARQLPPPRWCMNRPNCYVVLGCHGVIGVYGGAEDCKNYLINNRDWSWVVALQEIQRVDSAKEAQEFTAACLEDFLYLRTTFGPSAGSLFFSLNDLVCAEEHGRLTIWISVCRWSFLASRMSEFDYHVTSS